MAREVSVAILQEIEKAHVQPAFLYEGFFSGQPLRLWSGLGSITWGALTFLGNGWLTGFQPMTETSEIRADGFSIQLSSVPPEIVALTLSDARQNEYGSLWLGFLGDSNVILGEPYLMAKGRLDVPEILEGGDTSTLTLSYESLLLQLGRAKENRYTDQGQKLYYPGDRGFEYVTTLQEWRGFWGKQAEVSR